MGTQAVRERVLSREDRTGEPHQGIFDPYSIVQATQFFEFLKGLADIFFDGDKVRLSPMLFLADGC